MNAPDALTYLRLALLPVFLWLAELTRATVSDGASASGPRTAAVAVLAAMALTDFLDGFLARRMGVADRGGAVRDAVADKVVQVSVLYYLTLRGAPAFHVIPLWFAVFVVAREVLLVAVRGALASRRGRPVSVEHRWAAKLATFLFFGVLLATVAGAPPTALEAGVLLTTAALALAFVQYVVRWARDA